MAETIGQWDERRAVSRRDAAHPVIADHSLRRIEKVAPHLINSKTVLELGAGDGYFSLPLSKTFNLKASDQSREMLERNPAKEKEVLNACSISYPDNSFDVVFEANMLHHETDDEMVLKEMIRVSKDYIVILEPNAWNPFTLLIGILRKEERKSLRFSRSYVESKLMKYPVEEVSIFSCGFIPPYSCPKILWKLARLVDGKMPFLGLENVFIFRKKHGSKSTSEK